MNYSNYAICDDNPKDQQRVAKLLREYCLTNDYACNLRFFSSPEELLDESIAEIQVLFLDVHFPGMSGIDAAHLFRQIHPKLVIIFVSASVQEAPYGYAVPAFRYLVKNKLDEEFSACMDALAERIKFTPQMLIVKGNHGFLHVEASQVLYIEGATNRLALLHLVTQTGAKEIPCYDTLAHLATSLKDYDFLRIQRSYLVNMQHIQRFKNYEVLLDDGSLLPTSRKEYQDLKQQFSDWRENRI